MADVKLQKVLALQQNREKKAAGSMRQSREQQQQLQQQLSQLYQYRDEYEALFKRTSASGIDARILEDYRVFLAKLNEAIVRQHDQMSRAQEKYRQTRSQWSELWHRKKALNELIARNEAHDIQRKDKAEQKEADERSGLSLNKR